MKTYRIVVDDHLEEWEGDGKIILK